METYAKAKERSSYLLLRSSGSSESFLLGCLREEVAGFESATRTDISQFDNESFLPQQLRLLRGKGLSTRHERLMVNGLWLMAYGLWLMAYGFWLLANG